MIKCPVCRATYKPSDALVCRRCGAELEALIRIHDRALWHYNQAIAHFRRQDYGAAISDVHSAIALNPRQADFHAFAGQLWALQGDFDQAISAWKTAQTLDPRCTSATESLQIVAQLGARRN